MEVFGTILAIVMLLFLLYSVLKPQTKPKSKEQKQEEIRLHYFQKLQSELESIDNPQERQKRKILLLKLFAKELEFNLFFDEYEVKTLMKELAKY